MEIMEKLGKTIKKCRIKQGLTQAELAEQLGISTGFLGQIERGEREFGIDTLRKVIYSLNIPLDFFLNSQKFMKRLFLHLDSNLFEIDINKEILKECKKPQEKVCLNPLCPYRINIRSVLQTCSLSELKNFITQQRT